MTVSRRLRYEVLHRDNHTCRYCGASAPGVKMTVDHVTPTTLGGSDDPSNLVEAIRQTWGQDFRIRSLWKYFCGVAWNMVTAQHDAARALLDEAAEDDDDSPAVFRLPRRDFLRIILRNLMEDTEADAVVVEVEGAESLWRRRVLWGLENGYHRERARRDALVSSKHDIDHAIDKIFRAADGRAAAAKFKAHLAAQGLAKR